MTSDSPMVLRSIRDSMESVVVVAFALLVLGVVGTVIPFVPGGLLSVGGVLTYWYASGYQEPGPILLVALVGTGLLALVVDWFGGAIGAKTGGASLTHALAASAVGIVGLLTGGPLGLIVGVVGTIYLLEYREHGHSEETVRIAIATAIGVLASALVQMLLTGSMLVAMVLVEVGVF